MTKTWFITGASKGFGREWAEAALERGDKVAATARRLETLDALVDTHGDPWLIDFGFSEIAAGRALFRSIVMFVVFGLVMALAWARLRAPDLALAMVHWAWFAIPHGTAAYLLRRHYRPAARPLRARSTIVALMSVPMIRALNPGCSGSQSSSSIASEYASSPLLHAATQQRTLDPLLLDSTRGATTVSASTSQQLGSRKKLVTLIIRSSLNALRSLTSFFSSAT